MQDLKLIIANNIASVRKKAKLTQAELADKLLYSDKAVSKWERGESIPDILIMKQLADMFGVTVDYFLEEHTDDEKPPVIAKKKKLTLNAIFLTSCFATIALALILFFVFLWALPNAHNQWILFVCACPVICILGIVFNAIWWKNIHYGVLYIAGLIVSAIFTIYSFIVSIETLPFNPGLILILIAPLLLILFFWYYSIRKGNSKK